MIVGYMGSIPFVTSRQYLLTFDDYNRNSDGRWAKHDIIGSKPVLEFLGPDTETISMKIQLRRDHGAKPEKILKKLRTMRDTGEVFPLIFGSKVVGEALKSLIMKQGFSINTGLWVLKSVGEAVTHWAGGNIYAVDVSITLEEYSGRTI